MRFDYSDSNVAQGRANQELAKENPTTFGRESNTEKISQFTSLDKPKQRMAGEMGSRIIEYLQNPDEKLGLILGQKCLNSLMRDKSLIKLNQVWVEQLNV